MKEILKNLEGIFMIDNEEVEYSEEEEYFEKNEHTIEELNEYVKGNK